MFTKGLLGNNPYIPGEISTGSNLIEGYSSLKYDLSSNKNMIVEIKHNINFDLYKSEERNYEITKYIDDLKGPYKCKSNIYINDPYKPK